MCSNFTILKSAQTGLSTFLPEQQEPCLSTQTLIFHQKWKIRQC